MKRYSNLFQKVINYDNLVLAHNRAKRGKAHYQEVIKLSRSPRKYLKRLQKSLGKKRYRTSRYVVIERKEGRKFRVIHKLPYYPDRIVHHAIMNIVGPIWESTLIRDTYQSLPGRGVHKAKKRVEKSIRTDHEGTRYCLKMDIEKFYPSVDNSILKTIIRRKIKDEDLLWLIDEIIDSAVGLPIGNYLSQIWGNIYLSGLDHWVKEVKAVKYYYRYCDDIVIFGKSKSKLRNLKQDIADYLDKSLNVKLKSNFQVFPVDARPVDFLGYLFFRNKTLLRKSIALNFKRKVKAIHKNWQNLHPAQIVNGLMSYKGWMKYSDCKGLEQAYITPELKKIVAIASEKAGHKSPFYDEKTVF